jgi:hypothetical protein
MLLLFRPPLAHGQMAFGSNELGAQGRATPKEHADETQEIAEQFADASQGVTDIPKDIHASPIPRKTYDGNLA